MRFLLRLFPLFALSSILLPAIARSQSNAQLTLDSENATAGDTVKATLTFDSAPTCPSQIWVYFQPEDPSINRIGLRGETFANSTTISISLLLPKDQQAGRYIAKDAELYPCPGYSQAKNIKVAPASIYVKSIPDPNQYPTTAGIAWSPSQAQFFDTKIAELNSLSTNIDTRVESDGNDNADLRDFLVKTVKSAEAALSATEVQYRKLILKPQEPLPAFFADFHRQYQNLLIEAMRQAPARADISDHEPRLIYVQQQLNRRPSSPDTKRGRNKSGTMPSIAKSVKTSVDDNASAYGIVNTTGKALFYVSFRTIPKGLTIFYMQSTDPDYKQFSSVTDVSNIPFDLATYFFRFEKEGCTQHPIRIVDPYGDIHPNVDVELRGCK